MAESFELRTARELLEHARLLVRAIEAVEPSGADSHNVRERSAVMLAQARALAAFLFSREVSMQHSSIAGVLGSFGHASAAHD